MDRWLRACVAWMGRYRSQMRHLGRVRCRVSGQCSLTIAVRLIRAVLAVGLPIAAQPQVHTLATGAGELGRRAHGAALLVALVITLGEAVAAPGPRDAVDLPRGTGKLVGGTGGRLWGQRQHRDPSLTGWAIGNCVFVIQGSCPALPLAWSRQLPSWVQAGEVAGERKE